MKEKKYHKRRKVVVMISTVEMNVELHREVSLALEQCDIKGVIPL